MSGILQGPARQRLRGDEVDQFRASLIVDDRRRRPLYFDGRFLAARDLVRDQDYFLTRQADLGRAGGVGVVEGLYVRRGATPTSLRVDAGHGVTPGGELVVLPGDFTVELTNLPEIQRLNAAFGLLQRPTEPSRNRTGLFVLGLRPVEFSANPIASYPTSITGPRSVEDGDIVEGAVLTLIPYPDAGPSVGAELRRARVAHEVFVSGTGRATASGVLPLALLSLNRGTVEWVDVFLVRREAGAEHGRTLGLGFSPRGLREAHLLQYEQHLREVLTLRGGRGLRFAATEYFQALPPAGRLPAAAVDPADFTQIFFPPTVDVDLSIIPEDEVPALVEESLQLQPIDLTRSADELDSTAVLVLVPIPRNELRTLSSQMTTLQRTLRSSAPGMVARRNPLEHLRGIRLPANFVPLPEPRDAEDAAWRALLGRGGMLWYVRRRNLHARADLAGEKELVKALQPPAASAEKLNQLKDELAARDKALGEREQAVQAREKAADQREKALTAAEGTRGGALNQRETGLNAREAALDRREADLKKREADLTARDQATRQKETELEQRDTALRRRDTEQDAREAAIRKREDTVAGRETTVGTRETQLNNLDSQLRARQTTLDSREKLINSRETTATTRESQLRAREDAIKDVELRTSEIERRINRAGRL
ncbi:MAG TPA: hypothetical protein VF541_13955 [Longimicrobium sp.]